MAPPIRDRRLVTALLEVAPSSGSTFDVHLEPRPPDGARLGAARGRGPVTGRTTSAVAWLLVEGGEGELRVGGDAVKVHGRGDVFEHAGWSALVGPGSSFAVDGAIRYTIVWRYCHRHDLHGRFIPPDEVGEAQRGTGASARRVRTYLPEGPLIAGETLNYGGATELARIVHDGHVQRIPSGYHPVVAAPGYAMYYLWALAGQSDSLTPVFDPVHAWQQ